MNRSMDTIRETRKKIQKALRIHLSKMRTKSLNLSVSVPSNCKTPKSVSFAVGRDDIAGDPSAKLSDIDRFLAENFTSLFSDEETAEMGGSELWWSEEEEQCVAVLACSSDPAAEVRRSMRKMVEARVRKSGERLDWGFMEEILMCYLELNDKRSRGLVLGAFVDLVVELRSNNNAHVRTTP